MREASSRRDHALEALAEIANDNLADRLRHEAAARILVAARSALSLLEEGGARSRGAVQVVDRIASGWDPRAVTAREYVEGMPVPALDGLLDAAPRWASAMRDLIGVPPSAEAA